MLQLLSLADVTAAAAAAAFAVLASSLKAAHVMGVA
jgi:hypothetical protein